MNVLYRHGQAFASEILAELPDPPSYSAVRALLRILEDKGHVQHEAQGVRYLYRPTVPRESAGRSALARLRDIFFYGSAERVVATLLDLSHPGLSEAELSRLARLIQQYRQEEP